MNTRVICTIAAALLFVAEISGCPECGGRCQLLKCRPYLPKLKSLLVGKLLQRLSEYCQCGDCADGLGGLGCDQSCCGAGLANPALNYAGALSPYQTAQQYSQIPLTSACNPCTSLSGLSPATSYASCTSLNPCGACSSYTPLSSLNPCNPCAGACSPLGACDSYGTCSDLSSLGACGGCGGRGDCDPYSGLSNCAGPCSSPCCDRDCRGPSLFSGKIRTPLFSGALSLGGCC